VSVWGRLVARQSVLKYWQCCLVAGTGLRLWKTSSTIQLAEFMATGPLTGVVEQRAGRGHQHPQPVKPELMRLTSNCLERQIRA
jgi:hypothetical protein